RPPYEAESRREESHVIERDRLTTAEAPFPSLARGEDHEQEPEEGQDQGDGEEDGHLTLHEEKAQGSNEHRRGEKPPAERAGRPRTLLKSSRSSVELFSPVERGPIPGLGSQGFEPPALGAPGPRSHLGS